MANETRKISDVPELTQTTDKTKLLVEEDGMARRLSINKITSKNTNVASAISNTATGSIVSLTDISPFEHILGVKARSENLIPYPYYTTDTNLHGMTYSVGGGGRFIANGITTVGTNFYFTRSLELEAGTYTYSYKGTFNVVGSGAGFFIYCPDTKETLATLSGNSNKRTFTITEKKIVYVYLSISLAGVDVKCDLYLQLVKSTEVSEYTPYVDISSLKYAISNMSRTQTLDVIDTDVYSVFHIHNNKLFGEWLESLVGEFGENTIQFRIGRVYNASPHFIHIQAFIGGEWKTYWTNNQESETGEDYDGDYGVNSYLKDNFGFTFDEVGFCDEDIISFSISEAKVQSCGKNFAQVNSVVAPYSKAVTIFEGEISGDFVLSCDASNVTEFSNPTASLFSWTFKDGTVAYSQRADLFKNVNISGVLTKVELYPYSYPKGGSIDNIQLELGTNKTEFEPHKEPTTHPINADGTVEGVTSLYPTTMLYTNIDGVVIDVEHYNVDTKKYIDNKFAELAAMLVNS